MSTNLSNREFPEKSISGALPWLFERLRIGMRDTAKFVRMEAAWRTWPNVHRLAKPLHEALITEHDISSAREGNVAFLAERLALFYPTPDRFPATNGDVENWRHEIALNLGISATDDPNLLDDVLARYEADNGQIVPAELSSGEQAYKDDRDGWEALNQAVGGDLWSNPQKAAIMREIDAATTGASWEEFHNAVVTEIGKMPKAEANISRDIA